jgi:glutathione S-transferase
MITLHHLENSRSQRVLWLLEELGLPYEVKRYARDSKTLLAPPELRAVHPLGKSPVITDGELTLAETGAIIEYLLETYGRGRLTPKNPKDREAHRYWLHYAEGSAMPPFLLKLVFVRLPASAPAIIRPIVRMIARRAQESFIDRQIRGHLAYWEGALAASGWFVGDDLTAADIMMSFPAEVAAARFGLGEFPNIAGFLTRIHARPAYRKALERGGPYDIIG